MDCILPFSDSAKHPVQIRAASVLTVTVGCLLWLTLGAQANRVVVSGWVDAEALKPVGEKDALPIVVVDI